MVFKAYRRKERPNWKERMGDYSFKRDRTKRRIWIHTVSVGEFLASTTILGELRKTLPEHEIIVSVTTSSGHKTARENSENRVADGKQPLYDRLVYFPIDIPMFALSAMQRVQPEVVGLFETELWMNFLWAAKVFDARTVLLNGRISTRSFPRALLIKPFYKTLLANLDRVLVQTPVDRERIMALGAKNAEGLGNCKFDQAFEEPIYDLDEFKKELNLMPGKKVLVIGSTRGEVEEHFVVDALKKLPAETLAGLQIIHAPRHLERVPDLVGIAKPLGLTIGQRSKGEEAQYLILDTYGELGKVYAVADLVIVGGGFAKLGGHNILQPLAQGKPVIHGPHMENFKDASAAAADCGAALTASTPSELSNQIAKLINDEALRDEMGCAAETMIRKNLGASRRYAEAVAEEAANFMADER